MGDKEYVESKPHATTRELFVKILSLLSSQEKTMLKFFYISYCKYITAAIIGMPINRIDQGSCVFVSALSKKEFFFQEKQSLSFLKAVKKSLLLSLDVFGKRTHTSVLVFVLHQRK